MSANPDDTDPTDVDPDFVAVTTERPIDLLQLGEEIGTTDLTLTDDGTTRVVTCLDLDVTEQQLQDAVDAHTPAPAPPSPMATLQQQINELTDLILFGDLT